MRYFKVKYGFEKQDQVTIEEKDLQKSLWAQFTGRPVVLRGASVKGANIISITPAYHKHTGWYCWYEPTNGDDWQQISRDCPSYDGVIEYHKNKVAELMEKNDIRSISLGEEVDDKTLLENK